MNASSGASATLGSASASRAPNGVVALESIKADPLGKAVEGIVRTAVHGTRLIDGEGDPVGNYGGTFLDATNGRDKTLVDKPF